MPEEFYQMATAINDVYMLLELHLQTESLPIL